MVPRFFLARVSPLLADTVKVGEGGQVRASVSPEGMRLPSDAYTIRVDPLRLTLGRGVLLDRLVTILQAGQVSAFEVLGVTEGCSCIHDITNCCPGFTMT